PVRLAAITPAPITQPLSKISLREVVMTPSLQKAVSGCGLRNRSHLRVHHKTMPPSNRIWETCHCLSSNKIVRPRKARPDVVSDSGSTASKIVVRQRPEARRQLTPEEPRHARLFRTNSNVSYLRTSVVQETPQLPRP